MKWYSVLLITCVAIAALVIQDRAYRATVNDMYAFNVYVLSTYCGH